MPNFYCTHCDSRKTMQKEYSCGHPQQPCKKSKEALLSKQSLGVCYECCRFRTQAQYFCPKIQASNELGMYFTSSFNAARVHSNAVKN